MSRPAVLKRCPASLAPWDQVLARFFPSLDPQSTQATEVAVDADQLESESLPMLMREARPVIPTLCSHETITGVAERVVVVAA